MVDEASHRRLPALVEPAALDHGVPVRAPHAVDADGVARGVGLAGEGHVAGGGAADQAELPVDVRADVPISDAPFV